MNYLLIFHFYLSYLRFLFVIVRKQSILTRITEGLVGIPHIFVESFHEGYLQILKVSENRWNIYFSGLHYLVKFTILSK